MSDPKAASKKSGADGIPPASLFQVAVGLLIAYVLALVVLFVVADDKSVSETIWSRYTLLISGLEAIVFTAVGWLFGKEVNRAQAEQAGKAADEAKESTAREAAVRAQARTLQAMILGGPTRRGAVAGLETRAPASPEELRSAALSMDF